MVHAGSGLQDPALPVRRRSPCARFPRRGRTPPREYLGDQAVELHPALKTGLAAAGLAPALVAGPVKARILDMARQFVAGESPEDLVRQVGINARRGIATTIDLLGETVVSEAEADAFRRRNLETLEIVAAALASGIEPGFSDFGAEGPLPRLNLSVKISALAPALHPADPESGIASLKQRLRPILRRAADVGALINFDMESSGIGISRSRSSVRSSRRRNSVVPRRQGSRCRRISGIASGTSATSWTGPARTGVRSPCAS